MNKLANSTKRTSLALLALASVMFASGGHAAAVAVFCSSIVGVGPTTATLGAVTATMCSDVLENTDPDGTAGREHYQGFDGGGWTQVARSAFNSDSSGNESLKFDGFSWTSSGGFNSTNRIEAAWALSIADDQDPSTETPPLPKVYDLMVVVGKGTSNAADSVGYLLADFSFAQVGLVNGRISAGFLFSASDPVNSLFVYARSLDEPPPTRVPEPSSLLLLILGGLAAIGIGRAGANTHSARSAVG